MPGGRGLKEQWEGQSPDVNLLDHIVKFRERLKDVLEWAQESLKVSHEKMELEHARRARKRKFKIGDSVLVLLPTLGQFKVKFTGPGFVKSKVSDFNYDAELPRHRKKV